MRDIRNMLTVLYGEEGVLSFENTYTNPQNSQVYAIFNLPKDETMCLVSGYDIKARMAIIKRLKELETNSTQLAVPDFSNPAAAARAWADQYEGRLLAESTKAEIGSRREATAMNTASIAVKKVFKLEVELDKSKQYATVKRMGMIHHGQEFNWRLLKSASVEMDIPAVDVFDANYGTVKAYHADVWREAYAVEIERDEE